MAMQATGMNFSKIVLLSGAAYTALIMATNGQLADILGRLQLIWTEFVNKYFHWGNYICDTDCHFWSGFICSFDWEHAGLAAGSVAVAASLGVVKDGGKLFFRGQLIWEAVVDELMSAGMANAKQEGHIWELHNALLLS